MEFIGRRIYYEKLTGNVIVDKGEQAGFVVRSSVEQDYDMFQALKDRTPETVGVIELRYGEYAEDFAQCSGVRVNPETLVVEFSYPDPNDPETPPVFQEPLTVQVATLKAEKDDLKTRTQDLELMMGDLIASGILG